MTLEELAAERARLREERDDIARQLKKLHTTAGDDELTAGQQTRWANLSRGLDRVDGELEDVERQRDEAVIAHDERLERAERAMQNPANIEWGDGCRSETGPGAPTLMSRQSPWAIAPGPFANVSDIRSQALTAVELAPESDDTRREAATALVERDKSGRASRFVLATSQPDYLRAFGKLMADPVRGHMAWSPSERESFERVDHESRAMSLSNSSGGFMVPFSLDPTIIVTGDGSVNPLRDVARKATITTDTWNGVSSAGVTASFDAEAAEVSDDSPTLTQPTVTVHKAQSFVPYSIEAGEDIAGLAAEVGRLFSDAKDQLEASKFTNGTGSDEPYGVVYRVQNTTASRVDATTNNTFGLVDVYKTIEALPPRHRGGASWQAPLEIINDVRQFATANNYHAFLSDFSGDVPARMLGKPLYENSAMDGTIGTGDDDVLLVGDFSKYLIVDRIGMSVELVPHLFATGANRPSGQRGLYAYWRCGSDTLDVNAFRILRV